MISVVMPVYNSEKFLSSAIESILNQSFSEFEFLIFNDASTDNSRQIINDYIKLDNRIKFHDSSINKGYSFWLNESLKYINYNYLARMDADDISDKFRFQKQYDFLKKNQEYSVVGSFIKIIDEKDHFIRKSKYPINDNEIKKYLNEFSTFAHPSTMINTSYLNKVGGYRTIFEPAEDYDLWIRLSKISKLKNIDEYLLNYRQHSSSVSLKRKEEQLLKTFFIKKNYEYIFNDQDLIEKFEISKITKKLCQKLFKDFNQNNSEIVFGIIYLEFLNKNFISFILKLFPFVLKNPLYFYKRIKCYLKKNI